MTLNKDISERLNQRFLFQIDENTGKNVSQVPLFLAVLQMMFPETNDNLMNK